MSDASSALLTVLAFAALVTAHLFVVTALLGKRPRWLAAVALVIPPLAPVLALRAGARARSLAWILAAIAYAAGMVLATR